jgi:hypothetical protein
MAVAYKNAGLNTILADTPTNVYTAVGGSAIVFAISIANTQQTTVNIDIDIVDSSHSNAVYKIGQEVPIAPGGNLIYEQQITLEVNDIIRVTSDSANGINVVLSIVQFS